MSHDYAVVIPSIGRPSLQLLLDDLLAVADEARRDVVVVDDRPVADPPLPERPGVRVLSGEGRGPAHARNVGWRATEPPWVVFLDDDVRLGEAWADRLAADLESADVGVAGVQAQISVPLPARRPSDWERNVAGLEGARWATADMAYRRVALEAVGGFDDGYPRAFREDSDLALRCEELGFELEVGSRSVVHPVREAGRWISLKLQKTNADDARMRSRFGWHWRRRAAAGGGGRFLVHLVTTASYLLTAIFAVFGRRAHAFVSGLVAAALVGDFAWRRIKPGPRDKEEVLTMAVSSFLIPPLAAFHRASGELSLRSAHRR